MMQSNNRRRPKSYSARELLFRAADKIEELGLAHGTLQVADKSKIEEELGMAIVTPRQKPRSVSALGAVKLSAFGHITGCAVDDHATAREAYEHFRLAVGGDGMGWSDATERSAADVVAKLKEVAANV